MTGGQYSLLRMLLGGTLVLFWAWSAVALFGGSEPGGAPGWLADPFTLAPSPLWAGSLAVLAGVLSLLLAIGAWDRWLAVTVAYLLLARSGAAAWQQAQVGVLALMALLLFHAAQRSAPYLSWRARGRVDPGGGWRPWGGIPPLGWQSGLWVALVGAYAFTAYDAFAGRGEAGGAPIRTPQWFGVLAAVFVASVAIPRLRAGAWCLLLAAQLARLVWFAPGLDAAGMIVWHAFVFDPRWVAPSPAASPSWLFYDGHCGLCHRFVRFVLAEDPGGRSLRVAALQGRTFAAQVPANRRTGLPDSVVLLTGEQLLVRSDAVHTLLRMLGGAWRVMGEVLRVIPRPLRDFVYDGVARVRRRIFGEPAEVCPILPPHLAERFDD